MHSTQQDVPRRNLCPTNVIHISVLLIVYHLIPQTCWAALPEEGGNCRISNQGFIWEFGHYRHLHSSETLGYGVPIGSLKLVLKWVGKWEVLGRCVASVSLVKNTIVFILGMKSDKKTSSIPKKIFIISLWLRLIPTLAPGIKEQIPFKQLVKFNYSYIEVVGRGSSVFSI